MTSPFDPHRPIIALGWSVDAMNAAADRLNKVRAEDPVAAFAAIGETVWWVTLVNDTLKNRYTDAYRYAGDHVTPPVEDLIDGLRSVRHRLGHEVDLVEIVEPIASRPDLGDGRITAWTWKHLPPPSRTRARDREGYEAYERAVAGHNIVYSFTSALCFLRMAYETARQSGQQSGSELPV